MSERRCPSCGGDALTRGFIWVRMSDNPTLFDYASFIEGEPEQQRQITSGAVGAQSFKLEPHRCGGCGLVSWFAPTATPWRR